MAIAPCPRTAADTPGGLEQYDPSAASMPGGAGDASGGQRAAVTKRGLAERVRAPAIPYTKKEQSDVPKRAARVRMLARPAGPGHPLLFLDRVQQDDLHPLANPRDRHHNMTAVSGLVTVFSRTSYPLTVTWGGAWGLG